MTCSGCNTSQGLPKGCKNNGGCGTDGCDKLSVFDWLSNMHQPAEELVCHIVEIRFKNERKEFYNNIDRLPLKVGDIVAVEANPGHDVGMVSMAGELVKAQLKHKKVNQTEDLPKVYRFANQKDIDVWQECREKEHAIMIEARRISRGIGLEMKISDVEYQGDGTKATFYYTSENRVDFRQLIREFATAFKCRIEMRQIGYRQEAAKLGGIGSCGRELCCSTWLTDFRSVSTAAARYQQLSINPQKIAGQCGKLKCCLNYELDSYLDALKDFPKHDIVLKSKGGEVSCAKIDVFKREIWLSYIKSDNVTWYKFSVEQVNEFLRKTRGGEAIESLEDLNKQFNQTEDSLFGTGLLEENELNRFEEKKNRRRRNKNKGNQQQPNNNNKKNSGKKNFRKKRRKPNQNKNEN
ncbi:stage 0 sporulation family protein [Ornithobacterium rhinotracheale]|uniref:PSP1 domain-containing protein n=1 Tax=Ornithobacterium rhinotracheale TaxID=28251 RepID=UPI00387304D5